MRVQPERLTDTITLYQADCLDVLWELERSSIDAVITDPPYSSGGAFRGDRAASTLTKYVRSASHEKRTEFGGDTRDQRGFLAWSSMWLAAARRSSRKGL